MKQSSEYLTEIAHVFTNFFELPKVNIVASWRSYLLNSQQEILKRNGIALACFDGLKLFFQNILEPWLWTKFDKSPKNIWAAVSFWTFWIFGYLFFLFLCILYFLSWNVIFIFPFFFVSRKFIILFERISMFIRECSVFLAFIMTPLFGTILK